MATSELKIGVLISGSGSTAERVVRETRNGGVLDGAVRVAFAVSSKGRLQASGVEKMEDFRVPVRVLRKGHEYKTPTQLAFGILDFALEQERKQGIRIDGLTQLGWIPMTPPQTVNYFSSEGRFILNQHCGPLDSEHVDLTGRRLDFGGRGMIGKAVTAATLAYAWHTGENQFTESTVHRVLANVEDYDGGEILSSVKMAHPVYSLRKSLDYLEKDPDCLINAAQVVQGELTDIEHDNIVATLELISRGEQLIFRRKGTLIPKENADILYRSRALATRIFSHG